MNTEQYGPDRVTVNNWLWKNGPFPGIGGADILKSFRRRIGMPFRIFREKDRTVYKFYQGFDLWIVTIWKKSA